ncbi:transposase [Streptomyces sp. NBC_01483]|uniref:transposase n=1 Tax=Streptomyces sp. NBC_01483 TaxID=2903883 RepID=UPI003FCC3977
MVTLDAGRGDHSDEEWARLEPHRPRSVGRGGRWQCHRRVINGMLFQHRTDLPWRDCRRASGSGKPSTTVIAGRQRMARGRGFCGPSGPGPMSRPESTGAWSAWTPLPVGLIGIQQGTHSRPLTIPGRHSRPSRHRSDEALGRSHQRTSQGHLQRQGVRRVGRDLAAANRCDHLARIDRRDG